jgi:hypothetical protein
LHDGRACTESVKHARQCKKQHKTIETGNRIQREHAAMCGHKTSQNKRKKGKGNKKNIQHSRYFAFEAGRYHCPLRITLNKLPIECLLASTSRNKKPSISCTVLVWCWRGRAQARRASSRTRLAA